MNRAIADWDWLASRLVSETMPLTESPMVEAVSVMGRVHPFFTRAGMKAFAPTPDAKTERMAAALEAVGIGEGLWHNDLVAHSMIETLCRQSQGFVIEQMDGFCQKFTNRRGMPHSPQRTGFVLSKVAAVGAYYLWNATQSGGIASSAGQAMGKASIVHTFQQSW